MGVGLASYATILNSSFSFAEVLLLIGGGGGGGLELSFEFRLGNLNIIGIATRTFTALPFKNAGVHFVF